MRLAQRHISRSPCYNCRLHIYDIAERLLRSGLHSLLLDVYMGRKKTRKMSPAQFDAVQLLITHMSADRRAAARLALVEGLTQRSIAERYGWGRTAVDNAERTIWQAFGRYQDAKKLEAELGSPLPRGWVRVSIDAPRALIKTIQAQVASAAVDTPPPTLK